MPGKVASRGRSTVNRFIAHANDNLFALGISTPLSRKIVPRCIVEFDDGIRDTIPRGWIEPIEDEPTA